MNTKRIVFFGVYVAALVLSFFVEKRGEETPLLEVENVDLVEGKPEGVVIVGAFDSVEDYATFAKEWAEGAVGRVTVLPSTIEPGAIDALVGETNRVRVLGIGYGASAALQLGERLGDRCEGVALLEPVVSTRLELLGTESLNRALKGFYLAAATLVDLGVSDFGLFRGSVFDWKRADAVFRADLEKGAEAFETMRVHVAVFHGGGDSGEALGFALNRVRPGVAVTVVEGELRAGDAAGFIEKLDTFYGESIGDVAGAGMSFSELEPIRLNDWWAGTLLAVATFASEDLACIGGGLLAASGSTLLTVAVIGCLLGIFVGDLAIYGIGRVVGAAALEMPVLRSLATPAKVARISKWFETRGVGLVVLTRFLPGSRVPTYFTAGVVGVGAWRFGMALLIASAVWTPILVVLSFYLGDRFIQWFDSLGGYAWLGIAGFVLLFLVGSRFVASLLTWKGRRLLYSRFQRAVKWEFWPMWALYAPVLPYIAWLMLRYRSVTLPTAVNPFMPASGLVYESKSQILQHLERFGVPVARFAVIALDQSVDGKMERLRRFMADKDLAYPVVLKPDVGQRGQGVTIVKSEAMARAFFDEQREDTIAQEYVSGSEYGVFYSRFADKAEGWVSSITDKRMTSVVGDSESTLERLILADSRAVCMARFFLETYEDELDRVLGKGEVFWLASVGTHCRGALFLDGENLITPEMEAAVDGFSKKVEGFHFGRYDLRVPDEAALRRGEGIKVIELNGLTSEPTNMYDPRHSVFFAWRSLWTQWRLIFELAQKNRLAGYEPDSVKSVLGLVVGFLRGVPSRDLS